MFLCPQERKVDEWGKQVLEPYLRRSPERKPRFETLSGMGVEPLYTEDNTTIDSERIGFPGTFPYTRGVYPSMYRGRLWTMRQYAGYATAEESNQRYKYLLERGQTGLSVAFDLPTQIGYDSDHPMAQGEVGKVGVAIDSLADMERLFDSIPLDQVSTSMTINAPAAVLLAMYIAVAEKQGVPSEKLSGTVQNDILKEYAARGTYIYPPGPSMRLITDLFAYCSEHLPHWNTISISGYHIREAGSTAAQEIGFTLANGIAYVESALRAGLQVDQFAPRLSFFFNAHIDFFEEIAKFRAARRLWAKIMRERFGAKDPRSHMMRFHAQTAGSSLTAQQIDNNVVRVTIQALAAVLGGCQSLHTNARDEALALPTEASVQLALRTQQVIAYESGVTETVDPLGGSYFVEELTNRLEEEAEKLIERIDRLGGAVRAVENGWVQREIQESAYRYQQQLEAKERLVVGVNAFREQEPPQTDLLSVDPGVAQSQMDRLKELRRMRDNDAVQNALAALDRAARDDNEPLLPRILDAVRVYSTLGEICDTLRDVFGEYHPREHV